MANKLPTFQKVKVKVKGRAGFTFIDPAKPADNGHPLMDKDGKSYTEANGKVLLFERVTLPPGWSGEVALTPEVEVGLKRKVRVGRRDRVAMSAVYVTQLVKVETQLKAEVKGKPDIGGKKPFGGKPGGGI